MAAAVTGGCSRAGRTAPLKPSSRGGLQALAMRHRQRGVGHHRRLRSEVNALRSCRSADDAGSRGDDALSSAPLLLDFPLLRRSGKKKSDGQAGGACSWKTRNKIMTRNKLFGAGLGFPGRIVWREVKFGCGHRGGFKTGCHCNRWCDCESGVPRQGEKEMIGWDGITVRCRMHPKNWALSVIGWLALRFVL